MPILSLSALHFQIYIIQSVPSHHHCSISKCEHSTYRASRTLYWCSCFPRPVETTMYLNQRLVDITMFLNPQMATFEVVKWFMEAVVITKTPWPITSNRKYSMVDEAWNLSIKAQDCQRALAGALVGTPSVWQLPSGLSLKIDQQFRKAVSIYSVFCSSIGLMMVLNPK